MQTATRFDGLDVEIVRADLNNKSAITNVLAGHEVVINLAHDFRASARSNVTGFMNLVDACNAAMIKRLVHTSSIVVYDDWPSADMSEESSTGAPGSDYKNAKVAMENVLRERANAGTLESVIIQPSIVYGPRSWLWTDQIVERLLSGTIILPERCDGICNAVHVDDVVDGLILASVAACESAESFIVSGPDPVTWREFFESYNRGLKLDSIRYVTIQEDPHSTPGILGKLRSVAANPLQVARWAPVRYTLSGLQKLIGKNAIDRIRSAVMKVKQKRGPIVYFPTRDEIELYRSTGRCNIDKAIQRLGYAPLFDFERGVAQTVEHVRAHLTDSKDAPS